MRDCIIACLFVFYTSMLYGQTNQAPTYHAADSRVNALLGRMTLEEKIDYIGGEAPLFIRGVERLGIPAIKMSDGPVGVGAWGQTTTYPAGVLSAASWDTALMNQVGHALGRDARARGVHLLLGPGVNIYRAPMCGRNFEYFGEDPYLTSRMTVNYILGVQSEGVVATVKHFAANNQEWDRHHVSSDLDERTLREIYLPSFAAAVQEAKVGAVMNSYNLVNGVHATQNDHLNNDILKGEWGFEGLLMSDWASTYDGVAAAKAGLDLEMPNGQFMNRKVLLPAIRSGAVTEAMIDDKVRRILRVLFGYGFLDREQTNTGIPENDPGSVAASLNMARSGLVLLKNSPGVLPIGGTVQTVAVIGPNADRYMAGGGSSGAQPIHSTTLLQGIRNVAGPGVAVNFVRAYKGLDELALQSVFYTGRGSQERGLKAEYFNTPYLGGGVAGTRVERVVNHLWEEAPDMPGVNADLFSIRWTGVVRPETTGSYTFAMRGDDGFRLAIDGKEVVSEWQDQAPTTREVKMVLTAGKEYAIRLEYFDKSSTAAIVFAWYPDVPDFTEAIATAAKADVAVVSIGFDESMEGEYHDRPFALPPYQDSLINAIAQVNPRTVVVLNAGGNVYMQNWINHVGGLLHAWYPGQEGGTAIAEVLFGKVNPSGKLPMSFEKEWKDNPVHDSYYDSAGNKRVYYKEGLMLGYRYYDSVGAPEPQYPFGYGLSYTTFAYSNLQVKNETAAGGKGPKVVVSFDVTNTGGMDGAEVAQVYVHQEKCAYPRPYKELKGFAKVRLKRGEKKRVRVELGERAFAYYTEGLGWGYDAGVFGVLVGASSKDVRLKGNVVLQ